MTVLNRFQKKKLFDGLFKTCKKYLYNDDILDKIDIMKAINSVYKQFHVKYFQRIQTTSLVHFDLKYYFK